MFEGERFRSKRPIYHTDQFPSTSSENAPLDLENENKHKKIKQDNSISNPPIELALPILQSLADGYFKDFGISKTTVIKIHEYLQTNFPDGMPEFLELKEIIETFAMRAKEERKKLFGFKPIGLKVPSGFVTHFKMPKIFPSKRNPEIGLHIMYKIYSGKRFENRFRDIPPSYSQNVVDILYEILDEVSIEVPFIEVHEPFGLVSRTAGKTLEEKKRLIAAEGIKGSPVSFTYKIKNIRVMPRLHENVILVEVRDSSDTEPIHILPPLFFSRQIDKSFISDSSNENVRYAFSSEDSSLEDSSDEEEDLAKIPLRCIDKSSGSWYTYQEETVRNFNEDSAERFVKDPKNTTSYNCVNVLTNNSSEINTDTKDKGVVQANTDKCITYKSSSDLLKKPTSTIFAKVTMNDSPTAFIDNQADLSRENCIENSKRDTMVEYIKDKFAKHTQDDSKKYILDNSIEETRDNSTTCFEDFKFTRDSIAYTKNVSAKNTNDDSIKNCKFTNKRKEKNMEDLMDAITDLLNDIDEEVAIELGHASVVEDPDYIPEMEDSLENDTSNDSFEGSINAMSEVNRNKLPLRIFKIDSLEPGRTFYPIEVSREDSTSLARMAL